MTGYDFWLTLLIGIALGMLFVMALRWMGRKLLPRIRGKREAMPVKGGKQIEGKIS